MSLKPARRCSRTVAMKLIALSVDATQNTARLTIQSVCPPPCPGPATAPTALSGGYAVHPDNGAPPGTKNAASRIRNEAAVNQNERLPRSGNAIRSRQSASAGCRVRMRSAGRRRDEEDHERAVHGHQREVQFRRHHSARAGWPSRNGSFAPGFTRCIRISTESVTPISAASGKARSIEGQLILVVCREEIAAHLTDLLPFPCLELAGGITMTVVRTGGVPSRITRRKELRMFPERRR